MTITDVRVRKVAKDGKMKAVVSITLDEAFVVHDIKVIEGEKGLFIAMPSRKTADGEYRDIAHPINSQTREVIQNTILWRHTGKRQTFRRKKTSQVRHHGNSVITRQMKKDAVHKTGLVYNAFPFVTRSFSVSPP